MINIKIPSVGESIFEVELVKWFVKNGDFVDKNQELAEIESDKATLTITAPDSGIIKILIEEGATVSIGSIAGEITPSVKKESTENKGKQIKKDKNEQRETVSSPTISKSEAIKITPLAKKKLKEKNLNVDDVLKRLKRITTKDIDAIEDFSPLHKSKKFSRDFTKTKMSQLRQKISKRLIAVKNETAMLTTFNEVDMSKIIELRKKYQNKFIEKHKVKLGFMSFFTKAVTTSLKTHPSVNAMIDEQNIITYNYVDLSVAVQTPKGLMVPVIRNVESLSLAEIEQELIKLAEKAREAKISIEEMTGGTFTITNGGVFGSMLSTPIINPPQSAILGMHNIMQRPIVVDGKIEIKPMMYLALSYDHRIIDGKDAVQFLIQVKNLIENPTEMLFDGKDSEMFLLDL